VHAQHLTCRAPQHSTAQQSTARHSAQNGTTTTKEVEGRKKMIRKKTGIKFLKKPNDPLALAFTVFLEQQTKDKNKNKKISSRIASWSSLV
jgi:hypothetical protein